MDAAVFIYNDNSVLNNILNIKRQEDLNLFIKFFSLIRMGELKFLELPKVIDLSLLKEIHRYLFADVFSWAGEEDKDKMQDFNLITDKLAKSQWLHMHLNEKVSAITDFFFDMEKLHPFLVGTYQSAMIFISMLAKREGFALDQEYIDSQSISIEKSLVIDNVACREKVAAIIKEAIEMAFIKTNTYEAIALNIKEAGFDADLSLLENFKQLNYCMFKIHTVTELYDLYKYPDKLGDMETKYINAIARGFTCQETQHVSPKYNYIDPDYIRQPEG